MSLILCIIPSFGRHRPWTVGSHPLVPGVEEKKRREKMGIYVRIYTLSHKVKDVLNYTKNLKFVEIYAEKGKEEGQTKLSTIKEMEGLQEGDIVFVGLGGKGSNQPKKRELIGIVRIIGKPQRKEDKKGIELKIEAEVLDRFFDDNGNKIKEWREKWPEFESILGRLTSFDKIEDSPQILKKIQEILNARKFREDA